MGIFIPLKKLNTQHSSRKAIAYTKVNITQPNIFILLILDCTMHTDLCCTNILSAVSL